MRDSSYGTSFIHRLPAGFKLFCLFSMSILLFSVQSLWLAVSTLVIVYCLFLSAGFRPTQPLFEMKKIFWVLLALFLIQYFTSDLLTAALICLRLMNLMLLATLVTLTTPFSTMMECIEKLFSFTRLFGVNPAKISLALSLSLRFIGIFTNISDEVREAQKARGLENNFLALIMPVLIRSLKTQADVAAAIEARCYDGDLTDKTNKQSRGKYDD